MKVGKVLCVALVLVGCAAKDDYDKLKAKTEAESEAEAKVNQQVQSEKAIQAEADLSRRYRFYAGTSGVFEGGFAVGNREYLVRMKMTPSLVISRPGRVRTPEEISQDINNLFVNAQVVIWNKNLDRSAAGCIFKEVRADLENGLIQLIGPDCPNTFAVQLRGSSLANAQINDDGIESREMAQRLLNGDLPAIDQMYVDMQPTGTSQSQNFILTRVSGENP